MRKARLDVNRRTDLPNKVLRMRLDPLNPHQGGNMRLSVLAALGVTAFLGIATIDAPNANAAVRDTSIVSGPRGTAVVNRLRGARGAVIMSSPRRTIVRGRRGTTIVSRTPAARGAVIVKGRRGTAIMSRRLGARGAAVCRSVIVNGVRKLRC